MKFETKCSLWRLKLAIIALFALTAAITAPRFVVADGPAAAVAEKAPEKIAPSTNTPKIGEAGREAVLAYRLKNYVPPEIRIGDGYVDGGRHMKMHGDGRVSSSREIITVDRTRDAELRKQIEFARSDELKKLNPLDRATRLARHVAWLMTPKEGYKQLEAKTAVLDSEHRNREVLLGDVAKITGGAGVCRHRSLLYKILADEAGLKVALVRGHYVHRNGKSGAHAWNELRLDDGHVLIVDVTNPQPDFHFPDENSKQAPRYLDAGGKPLYVAPAKPAEKPAEKPATAAATK